MARRRQVTSPLLAFALLALSSAPAAAQTFGFTGGEQTYTVPAGITVLDVSMSGGDGGPGPSPDGTTPGAPGGHGGTASAVLTVSPGQVLFVEVGGAGAASGSVLAPAAPGWNGGGAPGVAGFDPEGDQFAPGGSGGGATDIRTVSCGTSCPGSAASLNSRLLVAGGGGGGGLDVDAAVPVAGSDANPGNNPTAVTGINGGTAGTSAPGGAGQGCVTPFLTTPNGAAGSPGAGGTGGIGLNDIDSLVITTGGGGGGGGYQGGGGGGGCVSTDYQGGGGGGGSNFASSAASNVVMGVDKTTGAAGSVSINPAPPSLLTAPAIQGTPTPGSTLTVVAGTYTNAPTTFAYQWLRCDASGNNCAPISGATGSVWPLTNADLDTTLRVQETATNAFGSAAAVVSAQTPVIAQPAGTGPPPGTSSNPQPSVVPTALKLVSVHVAGPSATVRLACAGSTGDCQGSIALKASPPAQHPTTKHKSSHANIDHATKPKKHKPPQVTVGAKRFTLVSGKSTALQITLNRLGRRLLDKSYSLSANLNVSGTTDLHRQIKFDYPRVRSLVTWTWSFTGAHTQVKQLNVTGIPRHARVTVLCHGSGCLADLERFTPKPGQTLALVPTITKGTLTAGAQLQITISAPDHVAKVVQIGVRANQYPSVAFACQPPDLSHPTACA